MLYSSVSKHHFLHSILYFSLNQLFRIFECRNSVKLSETCNEFLKEDDIFILFNTVYPDIKIKFS